MTIRCKTCGGYSLERELRRILVNYSDGSLVGKGTRLAICPQCHAVTAETEKRVGVAQEAPHTGCQCICYDQPEHSTLQDALEANAFHAGEVGRLKAENERLLERIKIEQDAAAELIASWDRKVGELLAEVARLRAALQDIATKHQSYEENGPDSYAIGVTDGHRCAAKIACQALTVCDEPGRP